MSLDGEKERGKEFFHGRGSDIARELVGDILVNEENGAAGRIVETEAYLGKTDPSCHFNDNDSSRDGTFRKGKGTVYVYIIHGHSCMNVISEYNGEPEGILIRAVEPLKEVEEMKDRRRREDEKELCSGPGKLTEAFGIEKEKHNGENIEESPISVYKGEKVEVKETPRIGISEAEDWPMRFVDRESDYLSQKVPERSSDFDEENYYSKFG